MKPTQKAKTRNFLGIAIILILLTTATINARIELVTVPERESISISIDRNNSALVQELRTVTVKEGENVAQFDWSNIDIDMNTVQLQVLEGEDSVTFGSMSIPPGSKNALMWDIQSQKSMELPVRVSYKVNGIYWNCNYTALVNDDETSLSLQADVTVSNQTQDQYENANINLEVGETFQQSLESNESKKITLFNMPQIPVQKTYTSDPDKFGKNVAIHYKFKNTRKEMLLAGKIRIYKKDKSGSRAFLGEDRIEFIPAGGEVDLYTGSARDVEVERAVIEQRQVNIRRDVRGNISVYDTDESYKATIKNHKNDSAKVIVRIHLNDFWENPESKHEYKKENVNILEFNVQVEPGEEEVINLDISGKNLTQGFIF
ncbi:DUF4139 domain-containing protein [Candidatus Poribacteria bacterium]|nr:DUF4139 domain-containing protein [Candidatus Poribacteria bacterium]